MILPMFHFQNADLDHQTETINRLLTKTASKRRGRKEKEKEDDDDENASTQPLSEEKPEVLLAYRWVSNKSGTTFSVL